MYGGEECDEHLRRKAPLGSGENNIQELLRRRHRCDILPRQLHFCGCSLGRSCGRGKVVMAPVVKEVCLKNFEPSQEFRQGLIHPLLSIRIGPAFPPAITSHPREKQMATISLENNWSSWSRDKLLYGSNLGWRYRGKASESQYLIFASSKQHRQTCTRHKSSEIAFNSVPLFFSHLKPHYQSLP